MELMELARLAGRSINQASATGIDGLSPRIIVRMPPSKCESATRRMTPRGKCPIGQVISRMGDYDVVAFDAVDVLAFCVAMSDGKIVVEQGDIS